MPISNETSESLLEDAARVLPEVRNSFARILSSLPGHIRRARDLIKVLGIHQTLAWKVIRIIDARDPFAAAPFIPGVEGVEKFLEAASRLDAPPVLIEQARAAVDEYRKLIATHAGDRASLELMLSASARNANPQTDLSYRKAGFQCASYIWGVQAKARVLASLLYPHKDPARMNMGAIAGYVGLRRVRPQTRWTLWRACAGTFDVEGQPQRHSPYRPIDPEGTPQEGVPLIGRFCSDPPPEIQRVTLPSGDAEDQWVEGPIGERSAVTCFTGEVLREPVPRFATPMEPQCDLGQQIRTPTELLVHDLIIHRDLFGVIKPELLVFSELGAKPWFESIGPGRTPAILSSFSESIQHLGIGLSAGHSPDIPQYADLLRHCYQKLGWDGDRCDVYRLMMAYPVVATAIVSRFDLPIPSHDSLRPGNA